MNGKASPTPILAICSSLVLFSCSDEQATMNVTVQKQVGDCFTTIAGAPISDQFPRRIDTCEESAVNAFVSRGDRTRLIIDYNVPFLDGKPAPTPTLHLYLDGIETPHGASIEHLSAGDYRWSVASFIVPNKPANELRLAVDTSSGYGSIVADAIRVVDPDIKLMVTQCDSDPAVECKIPSGVGKIEVTTQVTGADPQSMKVASRVNGIAYSSEQTVDLESTASGILTRSLAFDVPVAKENAIWMIEGRLGWSAKSRLITLVRPLIQSTIGCSTMCEAKAGTSVNLIITAPLDIHTKQAKVNTRVNGIPGLQSVTVELNDPDLGNDTISGSLSMFVPTPATENDDWQIDASVAGFHANTIVAHLKQ